MEPRRLCACHNDIATDGKRNAHKLSTPDAEVKKRNRISLDLLFHFMKVSAYPVLFSELLSRDRESETTGKPQSPTTSNSKVFNVSIGSCDTTDDGRSKFDASNEDGHPFPVSDSSPTQRLKMKVNSVVGGTVKTMRQYGLFTLYAIICTANVVRHNPMVWTGGAGLTSRSIVAMVYVLRWLNELSLYVFTSIRLTNKLTSLVTNIRKYETEFRYCDCRQPRDFNKFVKLVTLGTYIFVPANLITYLTLCFVNFPEMKLLLSPFIAVEGVYFFLACCAFGLVFALVFWCSFGASIPILYMSVLLRKEFLCVGESVKQLFLHPERESRLCTCRCICHTQHFHDNLARETNLTPSTDEMKNGTQAQLSRRDEDAGSGMTNSGYVPNKQTAWHKPGDTRMRANRVSVSPRTFSPKHASKTGNNVDQPTSEGMCKGTVHGKVENKVPSAKVNDDLGPGSSPINADESVSLETTFDLIERRHVALCSLLSGVQDCFCHVIPVEYFYSVVLLCFAVYSYSGGFLENGHLFMISFILASNIGNILYVTVLGSVVYEAAKDILHHINQADKSCLPKALLQKMQMTVQRLMSEEVGYHVYGFFLVHRPTILMLAGTILTYTVVVVQFQMGTCNCGPTNRTDF